MCRTADNGIRTYQCRESASFFKNLFCVDFPPIRLTERTNKYIIVHRMVILHCGYYRWIAGKAIQCIRFIIQEAFDFEIRSILNTVKGKIIYFPAESPGSYYQ